MKELFVAQELLISFYSAAELRVNNFYGKNIASEDDDLRRAGRLHVFNYPCAIGSQFRCLRGW